jgi:hypothetical protein
MTYKLSFPTVNMKIYSFLRLAFKFEQFIVVLWEILENTLWLLAEAVVLINNFARVEAWTFIRLISNQINLNTMYGNIFIISETPLTADVVLLCTKILCLFHVPHPTFHRKIYHIHSSAGLVRPLSHSTFCTSTKSNLYLDRYFDIHIFR